MQHLRSNADEMITTGLTSDNREYELVPSSWLPVVGAQKPRVLSVANSSLRSTLCPWDSLVLSSLALSWTWQSWGKSRQAQTGSVATTHRSHHKEADRERGYTSFIHQGKPLCQKMFNFLHGIGIKRLKNLAASFKENGLSPRTHGNVKKLPHNTLSFSSLFCSLHF